MKIRVSIYFEIKDSEIFGGAGSIGYVEKAIANMAKSLGVSEKCIRTINKEEYEENTGTEEEEL